MKGAEPADTVIENGRIVNVFTNDIEEGSIVVIKDGIIVSVENKKGIDKYTDARVIDAAGMLLVPGFIDAHTHMDSMILFGEFVPYSLRGGTTTVVTEVSAAACATGMKGVEVFMESTRGYPVRCYFLAPPLTPPFPEMEGSMGMSLPEFRRFIRRDDVPAVGEAYWTRIVDGDTRILGQVEAALACGKPLDGHAAGARGRRLVEYALTGITSCHESTTVEEAVEKLRYGMYVMIREGWVRRELGELAKITDAGVDLRRVMLVSDVFDAVMLEEEGYLDSIVRRAISLGVPPVEAVKMATINPADYYGFRHLGAIAPLRYADILFVESLEDVTVRSVMQDGVIVSFGGEYLGEAKPFSVPGELLNTIKARPVGENDLKTSAGMSAPKIRVIELSGATITREVVWRAPVCDGYLEGSPSDDILPVAVLNRNDAMQAGKGFVKGTGIRNGAIATTMVWDTGNILTIGSSYRDMVIAVNRLIELQGGIVIVKAGKPVFEFPMPFMGIMSTGSFETVRDNIRGLDAAMKEIGSVVERPFLTFQTIPFTGLPFLRITDKGLADIKNKRLVSIFTDR